jgi:hypothetical protein
MVRDAAMTSDKHNVPDTVKVIHLKQVFGISENPTWIVEKIEEVRK